MSIVVLTQNSLCKMIPVMNNIKKVNGNDMLKNLAIQKATIMVNNKSIMAIPNSL